MSTAALRPLALVLIALSAGCYGGAAIEGATGRAEEGLGARTIDECLSAIRTCMTEALSDPSATPGADAAALFQGCVQSSKGWDDESGEDVSCATACANEPATEVCGILERVFKDSAEKGSACVASFDECMGSCRSEADNMTDGFVWEEEEVTALPEATCLYTGLERTNCEMYANATRACGGTLGASDADHDACMQLCDASVSPWTEEDSDEAVFCADETESACEYCLSQCEDVPEAGVAWQTIAELADQNVRRGRRKTWNVTIPAETARFRVVVTPASADDDAELEVWAPGASQRAACTSAEGAGEVDTCIVEPLPGKTAVTAGTWRVVVRGASEGGSADGRHHYGVVLQVPAAAPSASCVESARSAIEQLEAVNETTLDSIGTFALVAAHSDHELIEVTATRGGEEVAYVVNAETLGGDPCLVYGVARKEEAAGLRDSGETQSEPPAEVCQNAARAAVHAVETTNGHEATIGAVALESAHSDRAFVRVAITRADESDSYIVSTETLGGDPCLVYGLQLKSQEIDLVPTAAAQ